MHNVKLVKYSEYMLGMGMASILALAMYSIVNNIYNI